MRFFSFDIQAKSYQHQALAQRIFIQKLLSHLPQTHYKSIAELGCGGGELFDEIQKREIGFEKYWACDSSKAMLERFRVCDGVRLFHQDFDDFLQEGEQKFDLICSTSALQWSHNLSFTLSLIAKRAKNVALSVLSASSLKSLHTFLGTASPLLESEEIEEMVGEVFVGKIYRSRVELEFETPKECLEHLKRSGVLGGGILSFTQAKKMLDFDGKIEYESINILGKPR